MKKLQAVRFNVAAVTSYRIHGSRPSSHRDRKDGNLQLNN
jgi:hypothetical protein